MNSANLLKNGEKQLVDSNHLRQPLAIDLSENPNEAPKPITGWV